MEVKYTYMALVPEKGGYTPAHPNGLARTDGKTIEDYWTTAQDWVPRRPDSLFYKMGPWVEIPEELARFCIDRWRPNRSHRRVLE